MLYYMYYVPTDWNHKSGFTKGIMIDLQRDSPIRHAFSIDNLTHDELLDRFLFGKNYAAYHAVVLSV